MGSSIKVKTRLEKTIKYLYFLVLKNSSSEEHVLCHLNDPGFLEGIK